MKLKNPFFLFLTLSIVLFSPSCKKDTLSNCSENFNFFAEVQDEFNGINSAATLHITDPSKDNCNAYKKAYDNYLDAVKNLSHCAEAVGQSTEYQDALEEAKTALEGLDCG